MGDYIEFEKELNLRLSEIPAEALSYDESEFWMIQAEYEFIEFFAIKNRLLNTAIALPLARGLHNGVHRKSQLIRDNVAYKVPYIIHTLQVCRFLIELNIPLKKEEQDILFAAALCHDVIEDVELEGQGTEIYTKFGMAKDVYDIVKLVSKRTDYTEEEELEHFKAIAGNKLSALVKLADRSNNVEDLYNRTAWKVHEYVGETRKYFFPMLDYAEAHYSDIVSSIAELRDKIVSITQAAEYLVSRYEQEEQIYKERLIALRAENEELRRQWKDRWHKAFSEKGEV